MHFILRCFNSKVIQNKHLGKKFKENNQCLQMSEMSKKKINKIHFHFYVCSFLQVKLYVQIGPVIMSHTNTLVYILCIWSQLRGQNLMSEG